MTVKAGAWYLDRLDIKLLPAGGICWYPNDEVHFDILFPNPKVTKRLMSWGTTEWWIYVPRRVRRRLVDHYCATPACTNSDVPTNGVTTNSTITTSRLPLGLEFKTIRQAVGHIEVGLSCDRQLTYKSGSPANFYPNNTVFVGAGLAY